MRSFNPKRLDLAMRARGITKRALSAHLDCSERLIGYHLKGEKSPEAYLGAYSAFFRYPESFFCADDVEEVPSNSVSFRALSKITKREIDRRIVSSSLIVDSFDTWLHTHYCLPLADVPELCEDILWLREPSTRDSTRPERAADLVRGTWEIGAAPIADLLVLLEFHGVRIYSLPDELDCSEAFSFWRNDIPYIFVDYRKTAERIRLDLAHELGHLVMHRDIDRVEDAEKRSIMECEANSFAGCFLMPKISFMHAANGHTSWNGVLTCKKYWKVSFLACIHRMHELRLISDWLYTKYNMQISSAGRTIEPEECPKETSQIYPKVMDLMRQDGITLECVATQNNLYVDELRSYLFGCDTTESGYPELRLV